MPDFFFIVKAPAILSDPRSAVCAVKPSIKLPQKFMMTLNDLWERSSYGFNPGASIVSRKLSSTCL